MLVKKIMSPKKITVSPSDSIKTAALKMRDNDVGSLLVEENNKPLGIVTDRDLTCRGLTAAHGISELTMNDVMSSDLIWCSQDEDVEDAIRLMEKNKIRRLPVMADDKSSVGILTLGDISTHLSHQLSGEVIAAVSSPDSQTPTLRSLG